MQSSRFSVILTVYFNRARIANEKPIGDRKLKTKNHRTQRNDARYALGVTLTFLAVGSVTAFNHEMWRDEIQAWLLARDSTSLFELFAHLKYEGHPGLWHLCLMPLSRITASPIIMQVFHLLIAGVSVYLFTRYAPFNRFQKLLFCFGYFALYEYAIVARNYALGLLLITLFCVLFRERYKRPLWIGGILFLLAHTSVHALIVTIAISFALFCEYLLMKKARLQTAPTANNLVWFSFALIGIGILTSVWQLKPPPDTGFAVGWKFDYETNHLFKVIKLISRAYLPIPKPTLHFWNSHQLEAYPLFQTLQIPLCFLLILCGVALLYKRPTVLLIYLTATLGLLAFFYVKYYGSIRHHGFLFLTFLMVAWIYRECPKIKTSARLQTAPTEREETLGERAFSILLTLILACHFIGGVTAVFMDNRHIFSCGKQTAASIKARGMQEMLMVGDTDFATSTVVGYLEKETIYYPRGSRFGSFIRWDNTRTAEVPTADVLEAAKALSTQNSQAVLIILNRAVSAQLQKQYRLSNVAHFTGSTIGDEEFYLYQMPAD